MGFCCSNATPVHVFIICMKGNKNNQPMTINVTKSAVTLFNNKVEECNLPSDWLNQS